LKKCITDITEIPASNGKLYVSAIFHCFDLIERHKRVEEKKQQKEEQR